MLPPIHGLLGVQCVSNYTVAWFQENLAVAKVRGNAGERRSWAPKKFWRAFPRHTQPLKIPAGSEGPFQLTVGAHIFQTSWASIKFIL